MSRSPLLEGLPPIGSPDARLLILGNMPSVLSLASGQYYGNPRNAFWRIVGELFGCDPDAPYAQRTAMLDRHGIAVWDVLRHCRRVGSLDSAIEPDSMVVNDFGTFFAAHPRIERVYFNGAAAERNFARLVNLDPPVSYQRLPSTSPAQTMRYADKLAAWRAALSGTRQAMN
jgi:hypoxanthine-DNA glycosylase